MFLQKEGTGHRLFLSAIASIIYSCYNSKDRDVSEKESGYRRRKNVDVKLHSQIGKTNQEERK